MKKQPEFELHKSVCRYLDFVYPEALYLSDTIASVKLTIPQGVRNKKIQKDGFKTPDLIILEPNKFYNGLFIELKVKSPFKKDGTLLKDEHLEAQQKTINDLIEKGYQALFAWDFDTITKILKNYMDNR